MERSSPDQAFLGIDAGGTKTDWVLLRSGGDELGNGSGPAAQLATHGAPRVAECFAELIAAAGRVAAAEGARIVAVAAGVAGAGTAEARVGLRAALAAAGLPDVALAGDPEVAAAATLTDSRGVAVWAGTGSFAVARGRDDRLHRVGGRGWLLGDEGGAFDLVRRAAAAAVSAADGAAPETALGEALAAACDLPTDRVVELGRLLQGLRPGEVAQLYWHVQATAAAGDAVAAAVLDAGAAELARLASSAARRAGLRPATAAVWLGGGLLRRDQTHAGRVREALAAAGFSQPVRMAERSAAKGAALLARALHQNEAPPVRLGAAGSRVMLDDLAVGSRIVPGRLLQVRFARSGGPGGQNVNKVASKVDLRLDLQGLVEPWGEEEVARIRERLESRLDADGRVQVVSSEHRSQADNLEAARQRLVALLRMALARPRTRRPTRPTRGSRERRLTAKRRRSDVKKNRRPPSGPGD